jgi:hypothetical protein
VRALAAVAVALAPACLAAPAQAQLLAPEDAAELAQSLAEAKEEQGVCYGWRISIDDESGTVIEDAGSSLGPGDVTALAGAECPKFVLLNGVVDYTSELSEAEDSASWSITSNLNKPPTTGELRDLGHTAEGLLGDEDDEVLANAVGALPLLVADHGEAKPVGFAPGDLPREQAGEPTGNPGSDLLRESWALLLICVLMLVGGLVWLVSVLRRPSTPTTDPGGP